MTLEVDEEDEVEGEGEEEATGGTNVVFLGEAVEASKGEPPLPPPPPPPPPAFNDDWAPF